MMKALTRVLLLGLCLALLAGTALANEVVDISSEGYDCFGYTYTLPDGRLLFTGCHGTPGNYMDSKARILCLNPDRTVSWEYIYPEEGSWDFGGVVLMKDGTLCVRLTNCPYQRTEEEKLVFFTQDGQLTGREIRLEVREDPTDSIRYRISGFGITVCRRAENEADCYTEYKDWDGNVLFRFSGREPVAADSVIEEEDGLVMIGHEQEACGAGTVVKVDWQGNPVWETVVPFMADANRGAMLQWGEKTSDGGYLALLLERPNDYSGKKWKTALVKFSSTGRVLWQNAETFDRLPDSGFFGLVEYNGKYVLQFEDKERFASLDMPIRYLWFDLDGNELGITELSVRKEELPRLENSRTAAFYMGNMFIMDDGLWGDFTSDNDSADHEKQMASVDTVLVKIPELQ